MKGLQRKDEQKAEASFTDGLREGNRGIGGVYKKRVIIKGKKEGGNN